MAGTPPLDTIERIVHRKGKQVEIVHRIGSYVSKPVIYVLPSPAKAAALEKHACESINGMPVTISLDWAEYRIPEPDEPPPEKGPST